MSYSELKSSVVVVIVVCAQALGTTSCSRRLGVGGGGSIYLPLGWTACSKKVLFHAWDYQQMGQKIN